MLRVYGLGDPVLDIVARVDHGLLQRLGAEPGGCVPVTAKEMAGLLALPEVQADVKRVPGGSAANVMKGLASLAGSSSHGGMNGSSGHGGMNGSSDGGTCSAGGGTGARLAVHFVGMVGGDDVAEEYERSIAAHGVAPLLLRHSPREATGQGGNDSSAAMAANGSAAAAAQPTATCLCLVTPDGQRTMRTSLGAALQLRQPEQLPQPLGGAAGTEAPVQQAGGQQADGQQQQGQQQPASSDAASSHGASAPWALLHCEGYCLYRAEVAAAAMRAARAAGARVSIDLASFEVICKCWGRLDHLLQDRLVDIVFCNEQEAQALCQAAGVALPADCPADRAVAAAQAYLLSRGASTVVVSRGSKGCVAKSADGGEARAAAGKVAVVDTVGAGDFCTAGFLYGLLSGASLQACALSGCTAGTAAVQVAGAELGPDRLQQLRSAIGSILLAAGPGGEPAAAAAAAAPS
ncbi:hypothetical protein ABPG75_005369 [Micractinium tetrahymenae]